MVLFAATLVVGLLFATTVAPTIPTPVTTMVVLPAGFITSLFVVGETTTAVGVAYYVVANAAAFIGLELGAFVIRQRDNLRLSAR